MTRLMTLGLMALLLAGTATATPVLIQEYFDYDDWLAAVGSIVVEDFSGPLPNVAAVVSADGVVDTTNDYWLETLIPGETTTFTLASGGTFSAFGGFFDLEPNNFGSGIIVTGVDGTGSTTFETLVYPGFDSGFYGVTVTAPMNAIRLTTQNLFLQQEVYTLDDLSFAAVDQEPPPPAIPEPTTLSLLGISLVGLGVARRFRKRAA